MPSKSPGRRVADILAAIDRIRSYVADIGGVEALVRDEYLHRDAVERQLLIIAEAAACRRLQGHFDTPV